jgi:cellulose synthase/poly-beta-1,6-N-acetylglucosamine synthase-like glycosyltransferase
MFLFWLFLIAFSIQCIYLLFFFSRIGQLGRSENIASSQTDGVSVIICARNEAANLKKMLPLVLSQAYDGDFEVIVVNDASTDNTVDILTAFASDREVGGKLKIITIRPDEPRLLQGKKFALRKGLAAARFTKLLLTDADCCPASNEWLRHMTAPLQGRTQIVAGYGAYVQEQGILNAFTRWETLHTLLQFSSYLSAGRPYMAVGRNMACTREILEFAQQQPMWNTLPSGDDDLLVQLCGTSNNMVMVSNPAAFTFSGAKQTWAEWVSQKQRHLSTGKYYQVVTKMLLGGYGLSHGLFWIAGVLSLFGANSLQVAILIMLRCIFFWVILILTARKMQERGLFFLLPFFDLGWLIYNFAFFPFITWKNKQHWT